MSAIGDAFRGTVRDNRSRTAVCTVADGEVSTFDDLAESVAAVRRALASSRIDRAAVIVAVLDNCALFVAVFVACMDEGLALVPITQTTAAELRALIEQTGAAAVIADRPLDIGDVAEQRIAGRVRLLKLRDPAGAPQHGASVVLKLTSGSTSAPKAAVASEMHLVNDGRHIVEAMGIGPKDINATYIPLSHSYAIGNVVMPLVCQGTCAALYPAFNPAQFVRDISRAGATVFPGVPFMFDRIRAAGVERMPAGLRLLITAGAAIELDLISWFRDRLDRKVHSFYGSSETGGITYDDSDGIGDVVHVGTALPETRVRLRDIGGDGSARIFVEGNAVASGYAYDDDAPRLADFVDGGFLTADLGRLDPDGRLMLTGRVSQLINVAGRKVDPREVERCLLSVRGVVKCVVLGTASDIRGQELTAFVVRADSDVSPITIRRACAAVLSPHKIPRRFVFVEALPVTDRGKIDRGALHQIAARQAG